MKYKNFIVLIFAIVISSLLLPSCVTTANTQHLQNGEASFTAGNFKSAFHQLLPLAAEGVPQAEYGVGYLYYYGYGVAQDSESGLFWMNKAASQHYAPAIRALAAIQENFPKTPQAIIEPTPTPTPTSSTHTPITIFSLKYTLQLMGSYYLAPLKQQQLLFNLTHLTCIKKTKTQHNGRDWYVLIYGNYTSLSSAELAKFDLPQKIKNFHPWTRRQDELTPL